MVYYQGTEGSHRLVPQTRALFGSLLASALLVALAGGAEGGDWKSPDELAHFLITEMDSLSDAKGNHSSDLSADVCPRVSEADLRALAAAFNWIQYIEFPQGGLLAKRGDMVWRIAHLTSVFYSRSLSVTYNKYSGACTARTYIDPFVF